MKKAIHNGCLFEIVSYRDDDAIIKITPNGGTFLSGETEIYVVEKVRNLTTNLGGGFEEWVVDNY